MRKGLAMLVSRRSDLAGKRRRSNMPGAGYERHIVPFRGAACHALEETIR
jgi:hypothetical protein